MSRISLPEKVERDLVAAAQRDTEKFAGLYEHYYPYIRRYFAVRIINDDVINDLTAHTFEKALKNIGRFNWQGYSFSAWLYRIASNTLVDFYRKQGRRKYTSMEDLELEADEPSVEESLEQQQRQGALAELLKKLPAKERKVIYLKFYEGLTNRNIAVRTGLSETNVGTIVYRGVAKLRRSLSEYG